MKIRWERLTAGLYEATYRGHTYRVERFAGQYGYQSCWMLSVDGNRPDDGFVTKRAAQTAALAMINASM